ncbi:flagellar hook assembly protein FlgD [Pontibacillus salicampi]|uniref:Flagellar hook assembly protein FlgD n=1 Tax=Pontibacillus salicampi TaxID=1449801 RepID=A0ABV6LP10_9BACI
MSSIDPSLYLQAQSTTASPSGNNGATLGKDDFLKILMTQLQNQDPTSPMKDQEFINQMTNFSMLEQMTNVSSSIEAFTKSQSNNPIVEYSHMIGKQVTYALSSFDETSNIKAVSTKEGKVYLELTNGEKITPDQITRLSAEESE